MKKLAGAIAVALTALATSAVGQTYPAKPVTIVVLSAAGSTFTALTRIIGDRLSDKWKQPVIIENLPGAGGLIASNRVKRAEPDGHTLLMGADAMTTYKIFMNTDFDMEKDLEPLSIATYASFMLQVNKNIPARTLQEFIAYAKANPGKLNGAAIGASQQLLDNLIFAKNNGLKVEIVSYPGAAKAIPALLAGDIHFYMGVTSATAQHFKSGALIPLAKLDDVRDPDFPDVPTAKEQGVDQTAGAWYGFFAPKGIPKAVKTRLETDIRAVLAEHATAEAITSKLRFRVIGSSSEEMAKRISADVKRRTDAANAAGIKPQ